MVSEMECQLIMPFINTDSAYEAWNNKLYVARTFCDISKEFGCVSSEVLLSTLE